MDYQWESRPFGERDMFTYGPIEPVPIRDIGLLKELRHHLLFLNHTIGTDTNFLFIINNLGLDELWLDQMDHKHNVTLDQKRKGQGVLERRWLEHGPRGIIEFVFKQILFLLTNG